ncbi:hypothetical protein AB4305_07155 [Nocardia sp. 2YAB30]|uniref:hypothetical protein n=1 Tax=Nocardia sp. 2YAB30 TaxID=3233022 RepID=UPI003F9A18C2
MTDRFYGVEFGVIPGPKVADLPVEDGNGGRSEGGGASFGWSRASVVHDDTAVATPAEYGTVRAAACAREPAPIRASANSARAPDRRLDQ